MKTFESLLAGLTPTGTRGDLSSEIDHISLDSRAVGKNGLFAALQGEHEDGARYINDAVRRGASAIVSSSIGQVPENVPCASFGDPQKALGVIASNFYGNPSRSLRLVGVTGTNGKTSTCFMLESIFSKAGLKAGIMGTVVVRWEGITLKPSLTTPQSPELQEILAGMVSAGTSHAAIEVSSHALKLGRVEGCDFDVAVFTNLTRDHLDFHKTMDDYFESKSLLFTRMMEAPHSKAGRLAVINLDDPKGMDLSFISKAQTLTYGLSKSADVRVKSFSLSTTRTDAEIETPGGCMKLSLPLIGLHNLYNSLAAMGASLALGIGASAIKEGLEAVRSIPGRLDRVDNDLGINILVDYAHTDDALTNVLKALNTIKTGRIITVFGCGGDRDRTKRPLMGRAAWEGSDIAVVTSDNPRTEDPLAIIDDIVNGLKECDAVEVKEADLLTPGEGHVYVIQPSRPEAIKLAVRIARPKDTILIAGKGHEDYQIIGTKKIHFDDKEEVSLALSWRKNKENSAGETKESE